MIIQYNIYEDHVNQTFLWRLAFLNAVVSLKMKNESPIYIVTIRALEFDKLTVEGTHGTTFKVKISEIERINVPSAQPER